MTKKATLIVVFGMVLLSVICAPALGERSNNITSTKHSLSIQAVNETEPRPVVLYFYGEVDGGDIKTNTPQNGTYNSAPPANYGGGNLPVQIAWLVGNWTTSHVTAPIIVETKVTGSLWATGMGEDVFFQLNIYHNDDQIGQISTDTISFDFDTEFKFSGTISKIEMEAGDFFSVRIYAGSRVGSNFQFAWGSPEYDSHIIVSCNPISLTQNRPQITKENVLFSATIFDAFSSTEFRVKIQVTNSVDVVSLSDPQFSQEENGTLVVWIWDHNTDNAKDGEYRITISVSYGEDSEFSSIGMYTLIFLKSEEDKGFLESFGWLFYIVMIMIIVGATLVIKKIIKNRRESKTTS